VAIDEAPNTELAHEPARLLGEIPSRA
jgi:hypothetical protein